MMLRFKPDCQKHLTTIKDLWNTKLLPKRTYYDVPPKIVSKFVTRVYYPFLYRGKIRDSQTFRVIKKQIKQELYPQLQFEEHLFRSQALSVQFKNPYTKESDYWKLASRGFKLDFPLHFEINSRIDNNEKSKKRNEIYIHLSEASVNFFTNNIGILEMRYEWNGEGSHCNIEVDKAETHSEHNSTTIQAVLDVQRLFLDPNSNLQLIANESGEKQLISLVNLKLNELVESIIDEHIRLHDFVIDWDPVENFQSYFVFSQVLTNQISVNKYSVWDYNQLALWTYLLATGSPSEFQAVKKDFLQEFLEKDCYLRWSSESGGLWIGFSTHGGAVIHFPTSYEEAEKLQRTKQQQRKDIIAQLIYPLLFQRIYLQVEINRIRQLITQSTGDDFKFVRNKEAVIQNFKSIEGKLLRFNLIFCDAISASSSATVMFEIWQNKLSITKLKSSLVNHVAELATYYAGLINESQQAKLTLLTVVVSSLGFSQILIEIISSSNTPLASSFLLYSVGLALIAYVKLLLPESTATPTLRLLIVCILSLALLASIFGVFGRDGLRKFANSFSSNFSPSGESLLTPKNVETESPRPKPNEILASQIIEPSLPDSTSQKEPMEAVPDQQVSELSQITMKTENPDFDEPDNYEDLSTVEETDPNTFTVPKQTLETE